MPRDLPVTTLQDVVTGDLRGLKVTINPLRAEFGYVVRAITGGTEEEHHSGRIGSTIPTEVRQAILAWVQDEILPAINEKEGL